MSATTAKQLYTDVQSLITEHASRHITPNTVALFNANLDSALEEFPDDAILKAVGHATEETIYLDLLTMLGQLMAAGTEAAHAKAANMKAGQRQAAGSRMI